MKDFYWTMDGWGSENPPENAEELISGANEMIDAYAETHDEDAVAAFSCKLWEDYCSIGMAFVVEDPEHKTVSARGMKLVGDPVVLDGAMATFGERRVNSALDDLCSYDGPLFRGLDGLYAVEFCYLTGQNDSLIPVPVCCWKLETV